MFSLVFMVYFSALNKFKIVDLGFCLINPMLDFSLGTISNNPFFFSEYGPYFLVSLHTLQFFEKWGFQNICINNSGKQILPSPQNLLLLFVLLIVICLFSNFPEFILSCLYVLSYVVTEVCLGCLVSL